MPDHPPTLSAAGAKDAYVGRAELLLFLLCLALHAGLCSRGWGNAILDTQGFRQAQTALVIQDITAHGFRLDYEMPVLGPPWSVPFEFPFYQGTVGKLCAWFGWPMEPTARGVALAYFYLALPALWLLLRRFALPPEERWLGLALVLSTPVYLIYSRSVLIESAAFCLSLWFLYGFATGLEGRRWGFVLAALAGMLAGATKVTTFAVFLLPGAIMLGQHRSAWRDKLLRAAVSVLPGVVAAILWTRHADEVKRLNIFGSAMTSTALADWVYGPLALRFQSEFWMQLAGHLRQAALTDGTLLVTAALLLARKGVPWGKLATAVAVAAGGPLVFANLYFVHDYYLYASGLLFLAVIALPLQELYRDRDLPQWRRLATVGLVLTAQFVGFTLHYLPQQAGAYPEPPVLARDLALVTRQDDIVVGFGLNWNPVLAYYSGRKAVMVPDLFLRQPDAIAATVARLGTARVGALVLTRQGRPPPETFTPWLERWEMDDIPLLQTGDYDIHVRKDMLPEALRALQAAPPPHAFLYQGRLGRTAGPPPLVFWIGPQTDPALFTMMHPRPTKVTTPFGLAAEYYEGRLGFNAHATSEIEVPVPVGARTVEIEFGLNPKCYDQSDGVEFEVVAVLTGGSQVQVYHRLLQPRLVSSDRGVQSATLVLASPLAEQLLFRTLPGPANNASFDWAYWSKIAVH